MSLQPESGQMKTTASREVALDRKSFDSHPKSQLFRQFESSALDAQIIAAWPRLDLLALEVGISRHRLAQRLVALTRDPDAHLQWPELARIDRVLSVRRDERGRGLVRHGGL